MLSDEDIKLRVKRGAAYMDEQMPGWEYKINIDLLEMDDSCNCIIGQTYESYWDWYDLGSRNKFTLAVENGFDLAWDGSDSLNDWNRLEDAWIEIIKERRGIL